MSKTKSSHNLSATDKAFLSKFNNILSYTANTKKIDRVTGEMAPHTMPLRQLMALLEVAAHEGKNISDYEYAGDSKVAKSKNLRALTNRGARERQNGFNFVFFKESPDDSRHKEVYMTEEGKQFVSGLVELLKEFSSEYNKTK